MKSIMSAFDDFFTGNTHDGNFSAMMEFYSQYDSNADLKDFW
jgi:hypothetical protein